MVFLGRNYHRVGLTHLYKQYYNHPYCRFDHNEHTASYLHISSSLEYSPTEHTLQNPHLIYHGTEDLHHKHSDYVYTAAEIYISSNQQSSSTTASYNDHLLCLPYMARRVSVVSLTITPTNVLKQHWHEPRFIRHLFAVCKEIPYSARRTVSSTSCISSWGYKIGSICVCLLVIAFMAVLF